jgi:hypothetical protein
VPTATAEAVGQAVGNALSWADSGIMPGPRGTSPATALRSGALRQYRPQGVGHVRPTSGLPDVTITEDGRG